MKCKLPKPVPGLCANVSIVKVRDGDTVEVRMREAGLIWPIRLIDVWAPELRSGEQRQQARASKEWLEEYLLRADPAELFVHIPQPTGENILRCLTFDRIPGYLWNGDECVNQLAVKLGYASSDKGLPLGT